VLRFIVRRLIVGLGILLISSFIMYMLTDFSMDYLADLRQSTDPNKEFLIAERIRLLDLETPVYQRYFAWLGSFVTGDLGVAWTTQRSVSSLLATAIVSTLQLVTAATFLAIFLGVGVGIVSALRQYSSFDYIITFVSFLLYSLPSFWVAVLLKEFGAIGFNNFLRDPVIGTVTLVVIAGLFGTMWMLAIGGPLKRRLVNFGLAFAATAGVFLYIQLTDWWSKPNIGPLLLALSSLGIAIGVTVLSTGLKNRRSLYTALSTAALGVALYIPMQWVFYWLTPVMNWLIAIGLGILAAAVGGLIGVLWRGPDWRQSVRTGILTAVPVAALIFIDRVMQAWGPYNRLPQINNRPIATIGDRTPNISGDFWIHAVDNYTHLILPTISLLLISFAGYTRYARGSMLEVMNQDYIRTARAKGLTERTVVMRHGFRNSLIPLATIVPIDVITLVGGALITERIFNRPGMGQLFIRSLNNNEIEPVMAYLVIIAFLAIVANIVADIIYALLDPRIRINA
jgi:peptide/nickel transport system permease protein